MKQDKVLAMLGLAAKAGRVASGEFKTEKAVKEEKAYLVIVAEDASSNTKKMFGNMTQFRKVPYYCYSNKEGLGHSIGKEYRASLAVTDEKLAHLIEEKLKQSKTTE